MENNSNFLPTPDCIRSAFPFVHLMTVSAPGACVSTDECVCPVRADCFEILSQAVARKNCRFTTAQDDAGGDIAVFTPSGEGAFVLGSGSGPLTCAFRLDSESYCEEFTLPGGTKWLVSSDPEGFITLTACEENEEAAEAASPDPRFDQLLAAADEILTELRRISAALNALSSPADDPFFEDVQETPEPLCGAEAYSCEEASFEDEPAEDSEAEFEETPEAEDSDSFGIRLEKLNAVIEEKRRSLQELDLKVLEARLNGLDAEIAAKTAELARLTV